MIILFITLFSFVNGFNAPLEEKCKSFFCDCIINMTINSENAHSYCFCIRLFEFCQNLTGSYGLNYTIAAFNHCENFFISTTQPLFDLQISSSNWFIKNLVFIVVGFIGFLILIVFGIYHVVKQRKKIDSS